MQKTPDKRHKSGADFAAELTRVHQRLREQNARVDQQAQFDVLRRLRFFHEFSHAEIWEGAARQHHERIPGGRGDREGRRDGRSLLHSRGRQVRGGTPRQDARHMDSGDCFGETSYVRGARRYRDHPRGNPGAVLRVSSTLLEQVSAACQLRFNRVFLRALVSRLQGNEQAAE
jgi:hypothetical protein